MDVRNERNGPGEGGGIVAGVIDGGRRRRYWTKETGDLRVRRLVLRDFLRRW